MKKRVVSLLLCLIMALSLIPTVAFATEVGTGGTPTTDADKTTNGKYVNNVWTEDANNGCTEYNNGKLRLYRTAEATNTDNEYTITLKVETSQTTTTTTTTANAATVLVIDTSGSMAWCTKNHRHTDDCYSKEECNENNTPGHWRSWDDLLGHHAIHRTFDDNWQPLSCRPDLDGKYYKVKNNCGQGAHNHDNAQGGEWCKNKDLNSATDSRIAYAKDAAKAFLESYKDTSSTPAARWVAIVSFNNSASSSPWYNVSTLDGYNNAVTAINALTANGGTNLDAGLAKAKDLMSNDTVENILKDNKNVVALTDGAPTKSRNYGDGKYGSENINTETEETAKALKGKGDIKNLYTICFAASNEECYQGGPSVENFLQRIASSADTAKTVADGDNGKLTLTFTEISSTIKDGLTGEGGWTVTDPMADNISVVDTSLPTTGFVKSNTAGTYTWTLSNPTVSGEGDTKTYTYNQLYCQN